jgi:hypothetical protein
VGGKLITVVLGGGEHGGSSSGWFGSVDHSSSFVISLATR